MYVWISFHTIIVQGRTNKNAYWLEFQNKQHNARIQHRFRTRNNNFNKESISQIPDRQSKKMPS